MKVSGFVLFVTYEFLLPPPHGAKILEAIGEITSIFLRRKEYTKKDVRFFLSRNFAANGQITGRTV